MQNTCLSTMSPLALLTRPRPDSKHLATLLRRQGIDSLIDPVINILPLADAALPPLAPIQALLLTSANGVRALAALLGAPPVGRDKPLLAVGAATAETARAAGFHNIESAGGDVQTLAALAAKRLNPTDGPLLHIAGSRIAGDLAGLLGQQGFDVQRQGLYQAEASTALAAATKCALENGKIHMVLFFSPRSARGFVKLIIGAALESALAQVSAICLSKAVADEAGKLTWRNIRVAAEPQQAALLDEVAREIEVAEHG
jgi:uroporphyrinogen-III synthase